LAEGYLETPTIFTLLSPFIAPYAGEWIRETVEMHTIWWILFSIVLFVGCYILYKKRKAETAQNAFAFSIVEIVIKFVSCFIGGFCLGWVMSFLGGNTLKANYMWFFAGAIMGILIINVLLHMIFHRGLEGYKNSLRECAVVSFALFAFVSVIVTGAFGFDKRVPKVEDVKEVCVLVGEDKYNVNGENILEYYNSDKEIIEKAISTHESIVQKYDKKYNGLYSLHSNTIDEETDEKYADEDIIIKYKLKNGKTMTRFYYYVSGIDNLGVFKTKVNNADMLSKIPVSDLQYIEVSKVKDGKSINDYEYNVSDGDFEMSDYEMIISALLKDISEQGVYTKKIHTGYNIELTFYDNMGGSVDMEFNIPESYKNTIEALKESGLGNCDYNYLLSTDEVEYPFAEDVVEKQTIYFELPKGWNENLDINCLQFNSDWDYKTDDDEVEMLANINSQIPLCEKVSDRLWKYTIVELRDEDSIRESYKQIMFCQQDGDTFRTTGIVELQKDENKNLLKLDKDFNDAKVDDEMKNYLIEHDYHWEEYKQ
jgi:hypothetical protein